MKKYISSSVMLVMILSCLCACENKTIEYETINTENIDNTQDIETDISVQGEGLLDSTISITDKDTEKTDSLMGAYELEDIKENDGFWILYPDGSFDEYLGGHVLTWDEHYMTYGMDYYPRDLIMKSTLIELNRTRLENGKLVLFWPYDNRREGLYPVEYSGYSLFRRNDEGYLEGLFYDKWEEKDVFLQWNSGHILYWSNPIEFETINGISKDEFNQYPQIEEGKLYQSFQPDETYVIGVVEGTTLIEKDYQTNYMFFKHSDESSAYKLNATADGYAIVDFSETPPGEYIFTISYWNTETSNRSVRSIYIEIE